MITVIKHGKRMNCKIRYICSTCGCTYVADNTDCRKYEDDEQGPKWSRCCPECGYLNYSRITMEVN